MKSLFVSVVAILFFSACVSGVKEVGSGENLIDSAGVVEEISEASEEGYLLSFGDPLGEEAQGSLDSGNTKDIDSVGDLWNVYENEEAGFSFSYPYEFVIGENLVVNVVAIENLEGTMGYDLMTAQLNEKKLAEGKYGERVDWPIGISKKVRSLGDVNAQEFVVSGRFEICDVTWDRMLYFFSNGYQVVIKLSLPYDELKTVAADYLVEDIENCPIQDGERMFIWDHENESYNDLYEVLLKGGGSALIQEQFDLFDQMVETFEFVK